MREFHIHFDARSIESHFDSFLTSEHGFYPAEFCGAPEGSPRYAPERHLSRKYFDPQEFRAAFRSIASYLKDQPASMKGYVEGEYVPYDLPIQERNFDPDVPIPF